MFLHFIFVCENISAYLNLNRPQFRIVYLSDNRVILE